MERWLTYLNDRFSIGLDFIALMGLSLSGLMIHGGSFQFFPFIFSLIGVLLFFLTWSMSDDLRNLEKDKIANPNNPLARGLLYQTEFEIVVGYLQGALFAYSFLIWGVFSWNAAFTYFLMALYLWHMQKSFFIPAWLGRHPLFHLMTSQVVILLVALFTVVIGRPNELSSPMTMSYAFLIFGAFFTYEIANKLNPQEHPVFMHLVQFYGYQRTYYFAVLMVVITAFSANALGMGSFLWPPEIAVFLALTILFFNSEYFNFVAKVAGISLLVHLWAGFAQAWI